MVTSEYFNGVLVAEIIDHGDGTGTRTTYSPDGTVDTVEHLTGLPIPDPEPPVDDPLAAVTALLAQVTPDQLARVLALGVAVTEPESVDRLTTAVETGDLADGVAVVADGEKVAVVDLASVVAEQVAAATAGAKAADVARAIVRPLETLTGGSTSTATRNALLSVRAELDKLIEG